jgi:hypothetical protein
MRPTKAATGTKHTVILRRLHARLMTMLTDRTAVAGGTDPQPTCK